MKQKTRLMSVVVATTMLMPNAIPVYANEEPLNPPIATEETLPTNGTNETTETVPEETLPPVVEETPIVPEEQPGLEPSEQTPPQEEPVMEEPVTPEEDRLLSETPKAAAVNDLQKGVTTLTESLSDLTFDVTTEKVLVLKGSKENPITFKNCVFNLSGETMDFASSGVGYGGESKARLAVGDYVTFENCTINAQEGKSVTANGNDCGLAFFGTAVFNGGSIIAKNWNGKFMALYGSANLTLNNASVSTVGNASGWSYAMFGSSYLTLNNSKLSATGMQAGSGNAFYSGDLRTKYDAVTINDSVVDFSDNASGGFAINNINIHVKNSTINIKNNAGNAMNSGYWIVNNSNINVQNNKSGHGLSLIGIELYNSKLTSIHNGYAGLYVQSRDSIFKNSVVDLRCNGERLLSYSAGDLWLNGHTLTVDNCSSQVKDGSAWLGAVGRKGSVVTPSGSVVAFDLHDLSKDNVKSKTAPILTNANVVKEETPYLFLHPTMKSDYARGNGEKKYSNNDVDLFKDDSFAIKENEANPVISGAKAKIKKMTNAQLAHHVYDWSQPQTISSANEMDYGVIRYSCVECDQYLNWTDLHPTSFKCPGTYVYGPTVGIEFNKNTKDEVQNMPEKLVDIDYGKPIPQNKMATPLRKGYVFAGWYTDPECKDLIDFEKGLVKNWTVAYAKWEKAYTVTVNYIDLETGKSISDRYREKDISEFSPYDVTKYDKISIPGYEYVKTDGVLKADKIKDDVVVNVYYKKVKHTVTINYLEEGTNKELHSDNIYKNYFNEAYDVTKFDKIDIKGYTYVKTEGDSLKGTLDTDKVINVYYKKNVPSKTEKPKDPNKGNGTNTGAQTNVKLFAGMGIGAAALAGVLVLLKKRNK